MTKTTKKEVKNKTTKSARKRKTSGVKPCWYITKGWGNLDDIVVQRDCESAELAYSELAEEARRRYPGVYTKVWTRSLLKDGIVCDFGSHVYFGFLKNVEPYTPASLNEPEPLDNSEKFILQTTGGRLVLVDLDVKREWNAVNLYWPNDHGKGLPHIWVGDDGGTEEEVEKVYGACMFDCDPPLPAYVLYDKETFLRRLIAKRDKYYPEFAKTTEEELIKLRGDGDEQ